MGAGRPKGSKKPMWRSKPAMLVRAYRYHNEDGSKYGCAKKMKISKHTVSKWWNKAEWTEESYDNFSKVHHWICMHYGDRNFEQCAKDTGLPVEEVIFQVESYFEITKFVIF